MHCGDGRSAWIISTDTVGPNNHPLPALSRRGEIHSDHGDRLKDYAQKIAKNRCIMCVTETNSDGGVLKGW